MNSVKTQQTESAFMSFNTKKYNGK